MLCLYFMSEVYNHFNIRVYSRLVCNKLKCTCRPGKLTLTVCIAGTSAWISCKMALGLQKPGVLYHATNYLVASFGPSCLA
ncbi:hypothetical protein AB205_0201720 [Aquarana catesbeiana]|uniref:Uncharacterized protein n=1 Tax=Aquarana catesbeiana TaxID=8400 RepID=A0A2G9QBW0_AQUCT|nr:hypothetical protein AB205_0201720 [Aquarana catesbeiana]